MFTAAATQHSRSSIWWQTLIQVLDRLFHLIRPIWVWLWGSLLAALLVSLISDLFQHGWDVFLNYQKEIAIVAFVMAHPAASVLIITPLFLLLLSWLAHRSPIAHLLPPRQAYLEALLRSYGKAELPIGPATSGLQLEAVFQPLKLRKDPLAAEDLAREERRAFLEEPIRGEGDLRRERPDGLGSHRGQLQPTSPVIASNGEGALKQSTERRMVILGGPGTGKTTLLKYLLSQAAHLAQKQLEAPLPIFISLPDYARSGLSLQEYLKSLVTGRLGVPVSFEEALWGAIEQGHAFLCLDSLDEVAPNQRGTLIQFINDWASWPGNTWIIGSRFTDYKQGQFSPDRFKEWEIQPLTRPLRLELAQRLLPEFCHLLPSKPITTTWVPAKFVTEVETHPQAASWGQNPLLFSLAAFISAQKGTLPSSRAKLYLEIIDAVLELREPVQQRRTFLKQSMEELALWLHQRKGRTFTSVDLAQFLVGEQQRSEDEATELAERIVKSGIVEVVAHETYRFRHLSFQEYLAGAALARQLASREEQQRAAAWELAWSKRTFSRWTEALRMMVGMLAQGHGKAGTNEALLWLRELAEQCMTPEGDIGDLGLALALKSLGEVGERSSVWREAGGIALEAKAALAWEQALLGTTKDDHPERQIRLHSLVAEMKSLSPQALQRVTSHLLLSLREKRRDVRQAAAKALGGLGEQAPVEPLVAALKDGDPDVRQAAAKALGGLGEQAPMEPLVAALKDEDSHVRQVAIEALGGLGEQAPVGLLVAAFEDEDWQVRHAAVDALGGLGKHMPVTLLTEALRDKKSTVRQTAAEVLGRLREHAPVEPLVAALQDEDWQVRQAAAKALGGLGERIPVEPLVAALEDEDSHVCQAAIDALGGLGERTPVEPLVAALKDRDPDVRQASVEALGELGEQAPVDLLVAALEDEDWQVRQAAAKALGGLGERALVEPLVAALKDEHSLVRNAAAEALGGLGERAPVAMLVAALGDKVSYVRQAAAKALGGLSDRAPAEPLMAALKEEDSDVVKAVAEALGEQDEQAPVALLVAALKEEDSYVRDVAAEALGGQDERAPVALLVVALKDEDWQVRQAAAKALGELSERALVEPLVAALKDKDPNVRHAAAEALGKLGERAPMKPLVAVLEDEDRQVRLAAAEALWGLRELARVELLVAALKDGDLDARQPAIEALVELDERAPVGPLVAALEDEDTQVRLAAAEALERRDERTAEEPSEPALEDEDRQARQVAALTGFKINWDTWLDTARVALLREQRERRSVMRFSENEVYNLVAARIFRKINQPSNKVLDKLTELLDWPYWQFRMCAAQALGDINHNIPDAAIKRLLELRREPEPIAVRNAAEDALAKILSLETGIEDD